MTLLLLYVLGALVVSFCCSILEAVLLSITPSHVAMLEERGEAAAGRIRALKDDIDRPLAAILSLNTIAHTVGAAGAGAQAARVFGDGAVGIFSAILTFIILVGTEIIPKTLGANHWKRLAPLVSRILPILVLITWPLVKLAQWLTAALSPGGREAAVSRDEIAALADEGTREGVVEEGESRLVRNLFRFSVLRVRDIMTPAQHVQGIDEASVVSGAKQLPDLKFSRVPIYRTKNGRRQYTGYVLKTDLLEHAAQDAPPKTLVEMRRALVEVAATKPLPAVFDLMVERREHIALAVDESKGAVGVVTMEDVIETLLGLEIFDEIDDAERIQQLARRHWYERARRLGRISDAIGGEASLGITGAAASEHGRRAS